MATLNSVQANLSIRNDTSTNLGLRNPILKKGELCGEIDTFKLKLGDGLTAYNDLPYINGESIIAEGLMRFVGVATTEITDGSIFDPQISGYDFVNKQVGDVIFYDSKEFIWSGTQWEQFGDENFIVTPNVNDLVQNPGDVLVLNCGSASDVL